MFSNWNKYVFSKLGVGKFRVTAQLRFSAVAPNIFGPSVRNLLITLLASRFLSGSQIC